MQDEYADASDPLPEGLIGNLKEFHVSYTEVRGGTVVMVMVVRRKPQAPKVEHSILLYHVLFLEQTHSVNMLEGGIPENCPRSAYPPVPCQEFNFAQGDDDSALHAPTYSRSYRVSPGCLLVFVAPFL